MIRIQLPWPKTHEKLLRRKNNLKPRHSWKALHSRRDKDNVCCFWFGETKFLLHLSSQSEFRRFKHCHFLRCWTTSNSQNVAGLRFVQKAGADMMSARSKGIISTSPLSACQAIPHKHPKNRGKTPKKETPQKVDSKIWNHASLTNLPLRIYMNLQSLGK